MLFERGNDAFTGELVLHSECVALLIVHRAKNAGVLTQVQKADEMKCIRPIVTGTQETLLLVVIELATTKVLI